ncbi:hypothetical protein GCM10010970_24470 [Silvimonas iriomotensis]|uniref:Uncharacterized protein n=2 Tax=Silvimonas TaxID=300264 RepID=A0ABQ2PB51_9NEIS|nr:hypothetical protein GCM10010970_24470 [Silvimonas iriomotensis]GGP27056.1 hypothetical protein GCM10010971_28750 [Silvimonas amylolytica]
MARVAQGEHRPFPLKHGFERHFIFETRVDIRGRIDGCRGDDENRLARFCKTSLNREVVTS